MTERLEHLHQLQQRQREHLQDPGYAPVLQQVQALSTRREAVIRIFQPLKQRLGIVDPTLKLLDNFIGQLSTDREAGRSQPDPAWAIAWRTAYLASTFLQSVEDVLASVSFEIRTPEQPSVPGQPSAEAVDTRWSEVDATLSGMRTLRRELTEKAAEMTARADAAQDEYDELSAKILDLTG